MKIPRVFQAMALNKGRLNLDAKAVQHVAHALRMKPGDPIEVFNGQGGAWTGTLQTVNKRTVEVDLYQFDPENSGSSLRLHLVQAVSKGPRMDYVMQKATELGVHSITPIITERCEIKLDESRWRKKIEGWQSQVYSACEQCGLNIPPIVQPTITLPQWIELGHPFETCFALHPHTNTNTNTSTGFDPKFISANTHVGLIIGPEGGFSESEISLLLSKQIIAISLGPRILRTETAPVVAISLLQYFSGNLS